RGAGWNCIKVIWGSDWDPLLAADKTGLLVQRMGEVVDGEFQKYTVEDGEYIRKHFFGKYPELLRLVQHMSPEQIARLKRGGPDPEKVYAGYRAATEHVGQPTVILAQTVKGYGLGEAGEGTNTTHQQKKIKSEHLIDFRNRFSLPISDDDVARATFFKPASESKEMVYLQKRRKELGGYLPQRRSVCPTLKAPGDDFLADYVKGSGDKAPSTTMA